MRPASGRCPFFSPKKYRPQGKISSFPCGGLFSHGAALTDLAVSVDDIFRGGQGLQAHGTPGVQLLGGDTQLGSQAELPPSVNRVEAFTYTAAASTC